MIGIIIGIVTGLNYISASWVNNSAYWSGTSGTMFILTILGIILFPKTIARILSVTLWFAPVAVILAIINGLMNPTLMPWNIIAPIVYAVVASIALAVVKFFRLRAREVNL